MSQVWPLPVLRRQLQPTRLETEEDYNGLLSSSTFFNGSYNKVKMYIHVLRQGLSLFRYVHDDGLVRAGTSVDLSLNQVTAGFYEGAAVERGSGFHVRPPVLGVA